MGDIITAIMDTYGGGEFAAFSISSCMRPLQGYKVLCEYNAKCECAVNGMLFLKHVPTQVAQVIDK